jgi:hypothetical protein
MKLSEFKSINSPWGFKVEFDCGYGVGVDKLIEFLGPRMEGGKWRWMIKQEQPFMGRRMRSEPKDSWRKARIYVHDEDICILLKMMLS